MFALFVHPSRSSARLKDKSTPALFGLEEPSKDGISRGASVKGNHPALKA
jgi:hypothetical protein